jgi:hypothetical protein
MDMFVNTRRPRASGGLSEPAQTASCGMVFNQTWELKVRQASFHRKTTKTPLRLNKPVCNAALSEQCVGLECRELAMYKATHLHSSIAHTRACRLPCSHILTRILNDDLVHTILCASFESRASSLGVRAWSLSRNSASWRNLLPVTPIAETVCASSAVLEKMSAKLANTLRKFE